MKNADERYRSDIPDNAVESVVSPYKREGGAQSGREFLENRVCRMADETVGYRQYGKDGTLLIGILCRG